MSKDDFDSKRPDHPDFMDTNELKKREFSGIRYNSLSEQLEIWRDGEIAKIILASQLKQAEDMNALIAIAMEDVFGIPDVAIDGIHTFH